MALTMTMIFFYWPINNNEYDGLTMMIMMTEMKMNMQMKIEMEMKMRIKMLMMMMTMKICDDDGYLVMKVFQP